MATPDFSKIWGSNVASSDRYTFTDADYLTGWKYIGSVPPAREAFDTLFRDIDTKLAYLNTTLTQTGNNIATQIAAHNTDKTAHPNMIVMSKTQPTDITNDGIWIELLD